MTLSRDTAPLTVRALVQRAEAIRESELQRLLARCPGLSERERVLIATMSTDLIQRLLHGAISKICEKAAVDRARALNDARVLSELFGAQSIDRDDGVVTMRSA
jgi:glutamyl-tRNA reductase